MRTRQCVDPSPEFGGKDCSSLGPSTETMICRKDLCPGMFYETRFNTLTLVGGLNQVG